MSLRKVYGGTPAGNESRCETCRNAGIIKGFAESERIVMCGRYEKPLRIPFRVAECSEYDDKRQPVLWELKQIAWDVHPREGAGKSGFVLGADLEKKEDRDPEPPAIAAETK